MKKRSMILALASMLGISAAATAVSGFAWFTTQTTASIDAGEYSVGAASGSLEIAAVANDINCTSAKSPDKNEITVTPLTKAFADVSSTDGENFYKLYNLNETTKKADVKVEDDVKAAETGKTYKTWMSEVNTNQMVAVTWSMTVKNNGASDTKMNVYLSHDGKLFTGKNSTTEDYENDYRLAIFNGTDLVYFYQGDATTGKTGIVSSDVVENVYTKTDAKGWDGTGFKAASDHALATDAHEITSEKNLTDAEKANTALTDTSSQLLAKELVGGAAAITLKFVVWCEGTLTPEDAVVSSNGVTLAMDLIGLNAPIAA